MRKYIAIAVSAVFLVFIGTSCLTSGLEDLDTYTGNDITSILGVFHRYYSSEIIEASGEQAVKQVSLSVSNSVIDADAGTCSCDVSTPVNFPESEKDNVSSTKLVVILNISTAAVIEPVGDAPVLGAPGDWSKTNKYIITAADGTKKEWAITVTLI